MEKGLELVVVAAILMIIAGVAFFMLNESTNDFTDTTGSQVSGAKCSLWNSQYCAGTGDSSLEKAQEAANQKPVSTETH